MHSLLLFLSLFIKPEMPHLRIFVVSHTKVNLEIYASTDKNGSAESAVCTQFNSIFSAMAKTIKFYMKDG
jgi:hypothetical protein